MMDATAERLLGEAQDRKEFQRRHGIIGNSVEIREVVDTIMQVAPTDITVLITGESGTGKEVIAKAMHAASRRASKRFVPVNCGAIPEGILESELFGHEKGAFTGAVETRKGYFELADGGTIFLDEIGDTPISTQVKLLRVLESGEYMRVGSSEPRHVDVRVLAATNKRLEDEVQAKRFRQDLFFRLRSVNMRLPALRHRRSDIPLLVRHFLRELPSDPRESILLTDAGMDALVRHSWPGNVRELKNVVESIMVLERGNVVDEHIVAKYVHADDTQEMSTALPVHLGKSSDQAEREILFRLLVEMRGDILGMREAIEELRARQQRQLPPVEAESTVPAPVLDDLTLRDAEILLITNALRRFGGNRRLAAEALGISQRTLYRKIKDYGI